MIEKGKEWKKYREFGTNKLEGIFFERVWGGGVSQVGRFTFL